MGITATLNRQHWKTIFLSSLGGMLEFYDFIIFAIFAVDIGRTFFPADHALTSTLLAFSTFAVGYLVRPFGGLIFGHFGDRYGRKTTFIICIIIMAGATLLMGITPGFDQWGITASFIFIFLRLLQGIAIGGEIPGAITFVKEHIKHRPGLACGMIFLFINLGIFLADIVYALFNSLGLQHNAWRWAFIIGGILAVLSYFLRRQLHETYDFEHVESKHRIPLFKLLHEHAYNTLFGFFICCCQGSLIVLLYLYVTSFMLLHHYTHETISLTNTLSLGLFSLCCALWGWLSDYTGQKPIALIGLILSMPLALAFYDQVISHGSILWLYLLLAITTAMFTGAFSAYLAKLFPVNVRFSGVAFCYNTGFAIFGGLAPLAATLLIKWTSSSMMPAYLYCISAIIGIIGIIATKPKPNHTDQ